MKIPSKLTRLVGATLITLGSMTGCGKYSYCPGTFRGYRAEAGIDPAGRKVILYDKRGLGFVGGTDVDNDGNFDKVWIKNTFDTNLIKYANKDSLEVAYSELTGRGR